jgi:hypothetical protein
MLWLAVSSSSEVIVLEMVLVMFIYVSLIEPEGWFFSLMKALLLQATVWGSECIHARVRTGAHIIWAGF